MIRDETALKRFATNVNVRMEKLGISQTELARQTGEYDARIANYRHGRKLPSVAVAARIAEVLDCTVDELLK